MPNPPTYNDLKRSKYSGKFKLPKRSKLIFQGVTSFIIPDLTLPDFNLFLGLDIVFVKSFKSDLTTIVAYIPHFYDSFISDLDEDSSEYGY